MLEVDDGDTCEIPGQCEQRNSFEDIFSYNGRAIQAHKIAKDDFNVFVYFDAQLYANELADSVLRGEKDNNTRQKKIDAEMTRRSKRKGRLTQEQIDELQPRDLAKLQEQIPEMGTVTIRTNRKELNSAQVYQIYKRRQAIEQFFKTYGDSLDFEASYMRSKTTQEAWLFLNHLSAMIGMDCLNSISMAEMTTRAVQTLPNGCFIGEQTYGGQGTLINSNSGFNMFYGGYFSNNAMRVYTTMTMTKGVDGVIAEGKGLVPDIEVPFDGENLRQGVDTQLERAVQYIRTGE